MTHRTVRDVMTADVFTVSRCTPFKAVAALLADAEVSAVPVVDADNRPVGIVSEGDLLCKQLAQPEPEGRNDGVWIRPSESERAEAESAEALMTGRLFTAEPGWSIVQAAQVMDRHHLKRLPVVDQDGVLVGIVSRSDLLRMFLRPDREIRQEILQDVLRDTLRLAPDAVRVAVVDGLRTRSCAACSISIESQRAAGRIVVGVDGSPSSRAALGWAMRQAGLTGSTVDAVITWEYPSRHTKPAVPHSLVRVTARSLGRQTHVPED